MPSSSFLYVTGGTLAPDAPSYVERGADRDLLAHLESGETCYVLNSRQMGKSSLCVRTIGKLKEQGIRTAFCDLTKFGGRNVTPEQWYAALTAEIGRDLGLRAEFIAYFKENSALPPVQRLFGAIVEVGLVPDSPLVVFIDEIDATRSLSFSTDEFFAAIRECHNRRVQDPRYLRLSFCMLGVAVPSDLINIATSTPFNIGRRIALEDFTLDEAMALSAGLCSPTRPETAARAVLKRLHEWTNGQPYLTQSLCSAVAGDETILTAADVDRLVHRDLLDPMARQTNINLADVANRAVHAGDLEPDPEKFRADLLSAYERIWRGKQYADDEANRTAALLKLSGIVAAEGNKLRVRNLIYRRVFDRTWVRENMPGQELRRQRRSFWKGVLRTSLVSAAVVCVVGYFAFLANQAQRTAEAAKKELDYQLYVAKMNNLQLFYEEGNVGQISRVIEETRNNPHRGWEWGYWESLLQDSKEQYILDGESDPLQHALFSRDAKEIMFVDRRSSRAVLVNRNTKRVVATYPLEKNEYLQQVGSEWVAWSDMSDSLRVRDLTSGATRFSYPIQPGFQGFVLGPKTNSGFLVVHQYDPTGKAITSIVDGITGATLWPKEGTGTGQSSETLASISADGSRLLLAKFTVITALTGTYVVRHRDGRKLDELTVSREGNFGSVISPSGRYWLCGDGDRILLRDLATRTTRQAIEAGPHGRFQSAEFDSSESKIVFLSVDNKAVVWSVPQGKELAVYRGVYMVDVSMQTDEVLLSGDMIRVVSLSPRSQQGELVNYVSRGVNGRIVVQALDSFRMVSDPDLKDLQKIELRGGGLAASWNGRIYATFESSQKGKESVLRETESGRVLARSKIGWYSVDAADTQHLIVTLTSDNRVVEVRRFDDSVPLWRKTAVAGERIYQAAMSPDGKLVITSTMSNSMSGAAIHDARTGKVLNSFSGSYPTVGVVHGTGDYWVSLGLTLKVFSNASHKLAYELPADWNVVRVIQSPDGRRILTVAGGMTLGTTIWDKSTRQRLCRIPRFDAGCFTRDGNTLVGTRDNRFTSITVGAPNPVTRIATGTSANPPSQSP